MSWLIWAVVLVMQNLAFTFVSRARNSGSLRRHVFAAIASNGIFFIQFAFMTDGTANAMMHGDRGRLAQVAITLFYTLFTVLGSIVAHYISLKTEKGKGAVGANKLYAQIPRAEWELAKSQAGAFDTFLAIADAATGGNVLVELKRMSDAFKKDVLTTNTISVEEIAFLKHLYEMQQKMVAERDAAIEEALGEQRTAAEQHNKVPAGDPLARPEVAPKGTDAPILGTSAQELV